MTACWFWGHQYLRREGIRWVGYSHCVRCGHRNRG